MTGGGSGGPPSLSLGALWVIPRLAGMVICRPLEISAPRPAQSPQSPATSLPALWLDTRSAALLSRPVGASPDRPLCACPDLRVGARESAPEIGEVRLYLVDDRRHSGF